MLFLMLPGLFFKLTGRPIVVSSLFGITFYIGVLSIVYITVSALRKRNYRLLIAPWWFFIVFLYLEYGSISFSSYQMMRKLDRFMLTMTPAMALAFGVVLSDVWGFGKERITSVRKIHIRRIAGPLSLFVMAAVLITSYMVMNTQKENRKRNLGLFKWGYYDILKERPNLPVYNTGGWWNNKLSFFYLPDLNFADMPWRHSRMLRDLKAVNDPSTLAGSHVIIDRRHFSGENDLRIVHSYDDFGNFIKLPPNEWELIGRNNFVEIYEVPEGWVYDEPDGKELALESLMYSMEISDFMLFLSNLHPDLVSSLGEQQFAGLVKILVDKNDPNHEAMLGERLQYKKLGEKWKITFNLD